ncbi:MAG TPA: cytochrome d ubiquinol oxidase subunit II [Gammaproteobacteria bacterium]|nr:cytochrome d ubiquinol oxidase subunit II [Gammaproteobacteria bacterium]
MLDYEFLRLALWGIIGFLFIGFMITDGFDMGVGILLPIIGKNDEQRRMMINAIAPHWDGNQVWFVTAGGALFAVWPTVYGAAFSSLYFAMLFVLFALFFRPVGFDYRSKLTDSRWRDSWDKLIFIGSIIPPLLFGIAFGHLFLGVNFEFDDLLRASFSVSLISLFHPFALTTGFVSVAMVVTHGACWLQLRTDGEVADKASRIAQHSAKFMIVVFSLAGLWLLIGIDGFQITHISRFDGPSNPLLKTVVQGDVTWWHNYAEHPWMLVAPLMAYAGAYGVIRLAKQSTVRQFLSSSVAIAGVILTAGFSLFPFIMPSSMNPNHSLTIWDATSSQMALNIIFWVAVVFIPLILSYSLWCYWVMWEKMSEEFVKKNTHTLY